MLQRQNIFILLVALLGLSACAGSAPKVDPVASESVESPGSSSGDYSIGPGDNLDVHVWRHEDLSRVVPVRPDGKISTPLVEDMPAAGKTASELARDIEGELSEYIKSPKVTIIVTGFIGNANDQIRVIGQAGQPRAIPYTKNMSLLDVMIAVGGLSEFAAPRRSKILRRIDGKGTEIAVRPDLLLERGDIRYDIPMRPGDVLIIPESRF
ncbi:MAG: XrtA/PEP-CTERM system exopolysaccharide export protein [Gammaproteobacteria bacterium]